MAVIVAMLVVAIVAVIATGLVLRQSTALRTLRGEQLRAQIGMAVDASVEQAARQLRDDVGNPRGPTAAGGWAQPIVLQSPLPTQVQLHDAQALFNLRNLVRDGKPDAHAQAVFERLCAMQGVAAPACVQVRTFVVARIGGAGPLPRDAQGVLALALSDGDPLQRQALAQVLTLLPLPTLLNANTSSAKLLAAELPDSDEAALNALLAERDAGRTLLNGGDIAFRLKLTDAQALTLQVGIHSEWFLVDGMVQADEARVPFQALIWREHRDLGVRVQRMWTRIGA
ncbi:MAG: type II secretion system minor pseudopilin GspK [Stenotrophomonas sp.]|uniref:type II secretion system minor pseudopilin GspK n=1 Tax=Stenotrophomonas sp. TaxID=69392 RepID=UPI003D6D5284